jgi:GT2 family glycosyltransferase
MSKLRKALELFRAEDAAVAFRYCVSYVGFRLRGGRPLSVEDIRYQRWRRRHALTGRHITALRQEESRFAYRPLISIIMPVFNVDAFLLERAVRSIETQIYTNWELCLADDCSTRASTRGALERLTATDTNIRLTYLPDNRGIAAASNAAIECATGEFIALVDHDDELSPDALFHVVKFLNTHPEADMIYSDEDKLDERGRHIEVFLKPGWSPELLLASMYTCHLGIYRKTLAQEIGGFRQGFEGAQDYDFALRLTEQTGNIFHLPGVLYHWRRVGGSTAKEYGTTAGGKAATAASLRALDRALERRKLGGTAENGLFDGSYRIRPAIPQGTSVSIIIPTRDKPLHLRRCVDSIIQKTTFPDYEVLIVDNRSTETRTHEYFSSLTDERISVVRYDDDFNFAGINNFAARRARGNFLVFLNNDTEVIADGWLEALLEMMQLPGVAVVGGKLLYPDNTIQHAGIVLWHCGTAGHLLSRLPADNHGYFGMADTIRNCTAVSAACMMVKQTLFREIGGFDELFAISYQDVDFCLRVQEAGYRIVFTPFARLYHNESTSTGPRTDEREERLFKEKWEKKIPADRYYSSLFPADNLDFRL